MTTKICRKCNIEKSINDFYKDSSNKKDGLQPYCIDCKKEYLAKYRQENKDKIKITSEKYESENKQKRKQYKIDNKEKITEYRKIYNRLHYSKNREFLIQKSKEYRINNPDKIKKMQEKRKKSLLYKAMKKNTDAKRRAKYKNGDITSKQMRDFISNVKKCYWCNCNINSKNMHVDHYIPLSKGGKHTLSNIVASCAKCNISKNAKDPYIFALEKGRLL